MLGPEGMLGAADSYAGLVAADSASTTIQRVESVPNQRKSPLQSKSCRNASALQDASTVFFAASCAGPRLQDVLSHSLQ